MINIQQIRNNFPFFKKGIAYFDNAGTTQKPISVIKEINNYYENLNCNTHSQNFLSLDLNIKIETTRKNVANFLKAKKEEIIFTKSTTESVNLLANGLTFLKPKDEIIIGISEHNSNLLPWLNLAKKKDLIVKFLLLDKEFKLDVKNLQSLLTINTKLLVINHISNILGKVNPIEEITNICKNFSSSILIALDCAQSVAHLSLDTKKIGVDFLYFSGHKMYSSLGIGVLWVKKENFSLLQNYQWGGNMINSLKEVNIKNKYKNKSDNYFKIDQEKIITVDYLDNPYNFEAGTNNFEAILALNTAINYFKKLQNNKIKVYSKKDNKTKIFNSILEYELFLTEYLVTNLAKIKNLVIVSKSNNKDDFLLSIVSFYIKNINSFDLEQLLSSYNIAIRSGKMCANLLLQHLKIDSVCRISLSFYNTLEEIDLFLAKLQLILFKTNNK